MLVTGLREATELHAGTVRYAGIGVYGRGPTLADTRAARLVDLARDDATPRCVPLPLYTVETTLESVH